ncbi:hypothetical protein O0L34_g17249 [Tuta absoluta]|nr:hypothetical protein O0L34_g17249 [Tuta absoluta]
MTDAEQVVFSAGNSWVVCRSKSYIGRVYYFNTVTGEAAWNLSDTEVEKAKQRTKSLAQQNKINIHECPEPETPPMDQTNTKPPSAYIQQPKPAPSESCNNDSPSTVYNKQVINNQITGQSFPFMVPPYNVLANTMNPILPIAVNSTPAFNPNVWAVPPTHQLYIGPSVPPVANQSQPTAVNFAFNDQEPRFTVQNTMSTLSGQFQNLRNQGFCGLRRGGRGRGCYQRQSFNPTRENHKFEQQHEHQINFQKKESVNDLRKILSAKRQRRVSFNEGNIDEGLEQSGSIAVNTSKHSGYESNEGYTKEQSGHNSDGPSLGHENETQKDKVGTNDADSDWLEENILVVDRKLKLDISNLKKLAKPDMDAECWYIVADKDVLLQHLNFLNILCNSDEHCYLMVAQQVMAELTEVSRDKSSPRTSARARRAVSFLLQQLDAGYVVIGDGTCPENGTRCEYLLNCCSNLYEQNYLVILLSNDNEFGVYKSSTSIPIFNIKEIKQFLSTGVLQNQTEIFKPPPQSNKPEIQKIDRLRPPPCLKNIGSQPKRPIKITVTNDLAKPTDAISNVCKITTATQFNGDINTTDKCFETAIEENHTIQVDNGISSLKSTKESAVQTDFEIEPESSHSTDNIFPQINSSDACKKTTDCDKNVTNDFPTPYPSKREIRLNRSVSVKTSTSNEETSTNSGKKHFKWRRKRHASSTGIETKLASANSSNADENSSPDSRNVQKADKMFTSCEQPLTQSRHEDSLSSEASSLLVTRNITNGTLTVEETSTSGIISNSASNADSESESGNKPTDLNEKVSQNSVMYEVTDQRMEECLRTMNDEWVSRFIQIMEEVLTQVLRKDEIFLNEVVYILHGGGPWNIREAADCIKIKYSNNCDIVDASRKLTDVFIKICDRTGRITANVQPSEFMEMYSFGKYLIESLRSVLQNCEDLESAAHSLQRLLADIRNPEFDASHNETFDTNFQDDYLGANDASHSISCVDDSAVQGSKTIDAYNCNTHTTPIKQIIRRSKRQTQNSPAEGSFRQPDELLRSNSSGHSATKRAEQVSQSKSLEKRSVTQSNSCELGSLKKSGEISHLHSPGQDSLLRPERVTQSYGQGSLRSSVEITQLQYPGHGSFIQPERVTQSHSPEIRSLRRSGEGTQTHSPEKSSPRRSREVAQAGFPRQGCSPSIIKETLIQSLSPGIIRTVDDDIQSRSSEGRSLSKSGSHGATPFSPGQKSLRISREVAQSDISGHSSLTTAEMTGQDSLTSPEEMDKSKSSTPFNYPGKGSLTKSEEINNFKSPERATPYKLRSQKSCPQNSVVNSGKKNTEIKKQIKIIRKLDVKDDFFTSLNLVKKGGEVDSQHKQCSSQELGSKEPVVAAVASSTQDLLRSIFDRNLDENSQGPKTCTDAKQESKVIRNFKICPEFEKKLERPIEREPLDMDQLDYAETENDDNYMTEYYSDEDYYGHDNGVQENDAQEEYFKPRVPGEEMPIIRTDPNAFFRIDDAKFICDSPLSINNNLNTIFNTIIRRTKETLLSVQTFCLETGEELSASKNHSISRKCEICESAERAYSLVTNMVKSLHNIFCRETYEPGKNIQSLLKDNGLNDFDLNDSQLKVYRDVIGQCLKNAQLLQKNVASIITIIKKKPIE